ncbi:YggU family protein [Deferribacter autotrophicus]|uniref:UPF0235 protein FHQ18_03190 n=1 Tax=Deferribacter autotrophicus TaxID=500465 RepID=A0A5A8F7G1_9BACT|nr:DUF167 domain-containing protein [Deferribacter autotrophicus]KAA0258968.1 YggU family protein [Deferribacter autotrophicus]
MGIRITLYIQPGAKKSEYTDLFNGMPKLKIASPPVDGAANKELIKFLSKKLGISKSKVKIISGEKSRIKTLEIDSDITEDEFIKIIKG